MIVFDLACAPGGHVFEAWFDSSEAFEDQQRRGLVSCPICGAGDVAKAVMAPRIGTGSEEAPALPRGPAQARAALAELARLQAKLLDGSEDVGAGFATRARAMHQGDEESRPIHGQASIAEARALAEDGVPVAPLPLPVRDRARDN